MAKLVLGLTSAMPAVPKLELTMFGQVIEVADTWPTVQVVVAW